MGERSIKHNEVKKKKKADVNNPAPSLSQRPIVTQPELIKKKKEPQFGENIIGAGFPS